MSALWCWTSSTSRSGYQYLDVDRVIADLRARPPLQHVVVTGRGAPPALVEAADTVTDMTPVKHAFAAG